MAIHWTVISEQREQYKNVLSSGQLMNLLPTRSNTVFFVYVLSLRFCFVAVVNSCNMWKWNVIVSLDYGQLRHIVELLLVKVRRTVIPNKIEEEEQELGSGLFIQKF